MKTCSIFILAVASLTLVIADEGQEKELERHSMRIIDECRAENAITPLSLCVHQKLGIQDLNGDINKDNLRAVMQKTPAYNDADFIDKVVAECGDRKGATAVEAALALESCMEKHILTRCPGCKFTHK